MSGANIQRNRAKLSRHYELVMSQKVASSGYLTPSVRMSLGRKLAMRIESQFLSHYFAHPPKWRVGIRRLTGKRTLPDFCVIGPAKAGTSDLAVSIMSHPNVLPPLVKEFWSANPEEWRIFYPTARERLAHAKQYGTALSPYCVPCLHWMDIPHHLSLSKPDMKVVILLREPTERLYSYWKWEILAAGKKYVESLPFLATFDAYVDMALSTYGCYPGWSPCSARGLEMSIYWKAVAYWIKCFGKKNVLVLDVGDYFNDRAPFLLEIQEFVGLPRIEMSHTHKATNVNPVHLSPPNVESMERLRSFFRSHNDRLWEVIGKRFSW